MSIPTIRVRVCGEFACFTRPEAKVERFSYPVMTPSAARNVLDAICWRPQMRWIVTTITVLKPIRLMSVLRNEVQSKVSPVAIKKWMRDASTFEPLVAGAGNGTDGTPRNTTLLRDVAYWIDAYPHVFDTSGDNAQAQRLFESIKVEKKPDVESPRAFTDYTVAPPDPGSLPEGITLIDGLV